MSNHRIKVNHPRMHERRDWYMFWPLCVITAFLLLPISFNLVGEHLANRPQRSDVQSVALGPGQDLHLDKSRLQNGQIHLFEASTSGQKLLFLVQQTQNRVVHVALASCKACYHNRDSHYAEKGQMMCGKCKERMTFEPATQQATKTSCALPEIRHKETDHEVTVLTSDVLAQTATALQ
jgi:hypothetical protein